METHGDRNKLKDFNNVEHAAVVKFDQNTKILHKIPPPPLHVCLLGPTNTIIQNLEKVYPNITSVLDSFFLPRESYQGKTYEGNIITQDSIFLKYLHRVVLLLKFGGDSSPIFKYINFSAM